MAKKTPPHHKKKPRPIIAGNDQPVFAQPQPSPDPTSFKTPVTDRKESYDDTDFGYLRVLAHAQSTIIEFHPESDGGVT